MELSTYTTGSYTRGASMLRQILWYVFGATLLRSSLLPGSQARALLLRFFGARIGQGVVLKPGLRIKFPWRFQVGSYSWIGEDVWIDNLAQVSIGNNVCISQGVYFCTGNHDWSSPSFDLETKAIHIHDHVWIAARSCIAPGIDIPEGVVVCMGSIVQSTLEAWTICGGHPAKVIKKRIIHNVKASA